METSALAAEPAATRAGARSGASLVLVLMGLKAVVHLALIRRYGFHGDELYFIECGRHLALGYVDHAPMIPWLARAAEEIGGVSLFWLRLPAVLAGTATMGLMALLVREWGGGLRAQALALLSFLVAPAYLRMAAMLDIPVIEVFLCTAVALLVARALNRGERWAWLGAGALAGLGLLTKHTVLLWGASLACGVLLTEHRRALTRSAPWIALAVALVCIVPNLVWQAGHGYPTLEFSSGMRRMLLAEQGRLLFVLGQILYFHPLVVPVWVAGLVFALSRAGRAMRPFAILFLVMFASLLIVGGKPYYLASAYPPVLCAGGIAIERWLAAHPWRFRALVGAMASTGLALGVMSLPILPIRTLDATFGSLLGWIVPPIALTHDMHGEIGWDVHAATIDRVVSSLPPSERAGAVVLAGSYSQAAALNVLRAEPEPRAISGHMSYYLWGTGHAPGSISIATDVPRRLLERHYGSVEERARIVAPDARPSDSDVPVYVCRHPQNGGLRALWPALRRFHHGPVTGNLDRSAPARPDERRDGSPPGAALWTGPGLRRLAGAGASIRAPSLAAHTGREASASSRA